jgi:Periplasmic binding protein
LRQKLARAFGGIAIAALVFGGGACQAGEDDGDSGTNAACGLKIGFFGALTGDAAGLGIHIRNGAKLAIDQYNRDNADCTVELVEYDSQGDPAKAPALATQAVGDQKIMAMIGPAFSGESEVADPILQSGNLPTITPSATRPSLSTKGTARWSYQVPNGGWLSYRYAGQAPTHVVTLLPAGRVEVRDAEDGRVLAAADLLPPRPPSVPASYVQFTGDLMLVRRESMVAAYGLGHLDRRWTAAIDLTTEYVVPDCGETLCVISRLGGVRVLDPATGQMLWSDPTRTYISRSGEHLVAAVRARDGLTDLAVLDPETGHEVEHLGVWTLIRPSGAGGELIGMRTDLATSRAWLAHLDPANGTARFFGLVGGVTGDCQAQAGAVICRRLNAAIGVWR